MKFKKVLKAVQRILLSYILYVLVFGAVIFVIKPREKNIAIDGENFLGEGKGGDRVALVEGRYESYLARIYMIDQAEDSLDLAYYTLHDGETTRVLLGSILEAADRGVEVRILLDGIFHNLKKDLKDTIYAFEEHPNIELRFYEDLKPLQPWTLNNRLHDKFIIVDGKEYLLGGRNIGDKYFLENYEEDRQVRDRDVYVFREDLEGESSLEDLLEYFNRLWTIDYSQNPVRSMTSKKVRRGKAMEKKLGEAYRLEKEKNPDLGSSPACLDRTFATRKVSLVHNPLERGNKYPLVFKTIVGLASEAGDLRVQSPYVLPTRMMNDFVEEYSLDYPAITLYTNSLYSSPNLFAMAGYTKHRERIIDSGLRIYEYQGPGSIHGKSYVYDGRLAAVGSLNMDNRSAFLSTETMVMIDSEDFSQELLKEFDKIGDRSFKVGEDYKYITNGKEIKRASLIKKLTVRLLSVFTYFFDFML